MAEAIAGPLAKGVKKDATTLIILGVLTVILGVLALISPMMAGMTVAVMVGILMIIGGIVRTVFAFKAQSWGKGILAFVLGALTLLVGLVMVFRPVLGLTSLTLVLAAYFLIDGIFEIFEAFDLKPLKGWGWMLFGGIVSVLLGFMIWRQWPVSGAWAIGILFGVKLIFAGVAMAAIGGAGRSLAGKAEDVIEDVKEAAQDAVESVKDAID